jgi:protein-tyrosine-phosphatase
MAAAYFKHICKNNADVDSAALMGRSGNPISPQTKEVLKEENIKLLRNKSKEIDDFDVFSSDIIVPMTQSHKYYLLRDYPKVENKVHTLMSFVGKPLKDIDDPFMKPIKIYQETFDMMKPPLKALCKKLKK